MKISLFEIAKKIDGEVSGSPDKSISGVAPFDQAGIDDLTLAGNVKFLKRISETDAGAVIVPLNYKGSDSNLIRAQNPQLAFAKAVELFFPTPPEKEDISKQAVIGKNSTYGRQVYIGSFVTIGNQVTLGDNVRIHPGVFIGDDVTIGDNTVIFPNTTIMDRCEIGNRVSIHPGAVIGSDGFGFAPDGEKYHKIPQTGIVRIDDNVEIGAGVTIDRATFGKTWIQKGVKIDNLVHVAHNVIVGENTILVAQVGIAGSATIGNHAILAGQVGISGHIHIGNNVTVGPQSGVAKSIPDGQIVSGSAAIPHKTWLRVQKIIPMLPELKKKISQLEKKLAALCKP